jgi:hypothetical protein
MLKKEMSPQSLLPGLKAWFAEYLHRFDSDDPTVQENMDVNFPRTFQIVREKKYLEAIRDALPKESPLVTELYERARAHLEQKASGGQKTFQQTDLCRFVAKHR